MYSCAIRGRYKDNKIVQVVESRFDEISNSITTVQKDSLIITNNKKEIQNMWKNELKRFKFNMDEVRLFDSFSGIGALHQSLKDLGVPTKVIGLSEVDIDAIISYAAIHIPDFLKLEFNYPTEDEMREYLMDKNIGWDFMKQKSSIPRLKKDKLYKVYKATILTNNFGDISKLDYDKLPDFDLFNCSFCCQDISNSGKQKGLTNEDGTHTRSGLVKFGIDLIKSKKPKYIMIENVKGLIQKKFINDFYSIVDEIEDIGYKCHYPTKQDKKGNVDPICLNAKNYGIPQSRERIFVICVRNDIDLEFEFPMGGDKGIRLKHVLEDYVAKKYYLSDEIQKRFKMNDEDDNDRNELNQIGTTGADKNIGQRDRTYGINGVCPNLTSTDYKQPKQIIDNNTLNMLGMLDIKGNEQIRRVYSNEGLSPTLSTMQGGNRQPKTIDGLKDFKIRKLTPLCCWRLMGFSDEAFYKAKETGVSDSALYKQAGNSIVVNCLYYIFKEVFKQYIIK